MRGMRLRACLWLVIAVCVLIAWVFQVTSAGRFPLQTNLLALLPLTERNPVAEQAIGKLTDAAGDRAIFLVGHRNSETAAAAGRSFAVHLRQNNVFQQVVADLPPFDPQQFTSLYRQHRFNLLTEDDRNALTSGTMDLEGRLQQKLYAPFRFGLTLSPAEDPFGLTDNWLASLPLKNLKLEPENGVLAIHADDMTWIFVAVKLPGSAYESDIQHRVVQAVERAEAALGKAYPDAKLLRSGTVFYAAAARTSAESEVDLIGAGSLVGMLLMLYLVFRSLRPLALGLLSVGFGIATAIVFTVWIYGEMHLITVVFGASLIGEAIDYAIQYFAAHLGAGKDWDPIVGLRRIAPGLTAALATSLLGYGALMLTPFPALAQIALFALVGLSAAWLSVFLLLPAMLIRPNKRDPIAAVAVPQRFLVWWQARMSRSSCIVLSGFLLVLAAPGWLMLHSDDDIRLLVNRSPLLVAQEDQVRKLTGLGNSSVFYLIEGSTPNAVLEAGERLEGRIALLREQGNITSYQSISAFVPSAQRQVLNHSIWQANVFADTTALRKLFDRAGLRDEILDQQISSFNATPNQILEVNEWLRSGLSEPYRHLWLGLTQHGFASIAVPQGVRDVARLESAIADLPGITLVDKAGSVSSLFKQYRQWGAFSLLIALVLVYCVLCARYRWRQAVVVIAPTVLAMAMAMGIFGYIKVPITLFNLMGLILVLGVGVNYAIFLREGGVRTAATLAGVLLSAGTTLLSFGLLSFSSMPALSSFGITLLVGVGIAVLLAPMVISFDTRSVL